MNHRHRTKITLIPFRSEMDGDALNEDVPLVQRCQQIKPDLINLTNKSNRPDQVVIFTYLVKPDFIDNLFDAV